MNYVQHGTHDNKSTQEQSGSSREVPSADFGEKTFCPKCSYWLRGIPEHRCPECGFGFDHQGVDHISAVDMEARDKHSRKATIRATFSIALGLSPMMTRHGSPWLVRLGVATSALLIAYALYRRYSEVPPWQGLRIFSGILAWAGVIFVAEIVASAPEVGAVSATILCVAAWYAWLMSPQRFPYSVLTGTREERRVVVGRAWIALAMLAGSSIAVVMTWL
jgi:hypothetical protein